MATCKDCLHFNDCLSCGKTRYYGENSACVDNIEKCGNVMNMEEFTIGNKDDINSAIDGLGQFCHSFCMNCEETEKINDLVFRCKECPFEDNVTGKCSVKVFLNKYGTPEQIDRATCMGSL